MRNDIRPFPLSHEETKEQQPNALILPLRSHMCQDTRLHRLRLRVRNYYIESGKLWYMMKLNLTLKNTGEIIQ